VANSNSADALNLYSKVEDLLGIKEYAPKLYSNFFSILDSLDFKSLLDIGCGSGDFLYDINRKYSLDRLNGIDRSSYMVKSAKERGLDVSTKSLSEISYKYDIATATFDMVNYLTPDEFIEFFKELRAIIKVGGYFVFDVNSEFGLSEVAVGNFIAEDDNRFLAIESYYEAGLYDSKFTLFEKNGTLYSNSCEYISQYFYDKTFFELLDGWEITECLPIKLYDFENFDKTIYILKNI